MTRGIPLALAGLTVVACDPASDPRESGPTLPFAVSEVPILDIGEVEGPPEVLFGRVTDLAVLRNGDILVGDDHLREVRVFSPTGEFIRSFGEVDEGPGHLRGIASVELYRGDSIAVADPWLERVSIFDSAGAFGRSVELRFDNGYTVHTPRVLPDGRFVVWAPPDRTAMSDVGTRLDSAWIVIASPDGTPMDSLLRWPMVQRAEPNRSRGGTLGATTQHGTVVAGREGLVVGWPSSFSLWDIDLLGRRVRQMSLERAPVLSTEEHARIAAERRYEFCLISDAPRDVCEASREQLPVLPDTLSAYGVDLVVDNVNRLWVRPLPDLNQAVREIFDPSGIYLGQATLPEGLRLISVAGDKVFGIWRDPLGVEHVRVHELREGS